MSDAGIKNIKVLNADLPIINTKISGYAVRYRIVSEDKNRVSHWSPLHYLDAEYTYVPGQIKISKSSDSVSVIWDKVKIIKNELSLGNIRDYEVWIKWGKSGLGDWIYDGKSQTNNLGFIIPETYFVNGVEQSIKPNELSIQIFLESVPVSRENLSLLMYSLSLETV